jgi:hypothetical protein
VRIGPLRAAYDFAAAVAGAHVFKKNEKKLFTPVFSAVTFFDARPYAIALIGYESSEATE